MNVATYFRLMRFHKPVGILLLWLPTAWALWVASHDNPPFLISLFFLLGTVLMRAAGCIVNDIADRHIDLHVKRTKHRPLTSGAVSLIEALILMAVLLFAALFILLQLPRSCFYYALTAVFITILYPFCKRFLDAPQLVLGIAFSLGIPMAYAALGQAPDRSMGYLLAINFLWVVAYDTQYAMADREDDLRIGVKSTAILFAQHDRSIIAILQIIFHGLWLALALELNPSNTFYAAWLVAACFLIYQQRLIARRDSNTCLRAFSLNCAYGLVMWVAIIMS